MDALLARAGSDKSRILRAQIYLADLADFAPMNAAWEAWAKDLAPGDPCLVMWHEVEFEARYRGHSGSSVEVLLLAAADTLVPMTVSWEDIRPPEAAEGVRPL